MAKLRSGKKTNNSIFRWAYYVAFFLLALWLLSSIILRKSPTDVLSSAVSKIPNPQNDAIELELMQKDSMIASLEEKLDKCLGTAGYTRGIVIIDGPTLNMRTEPSLGSSVIMRIPANSEVQILFYDTQTYFLEGISGKWVKLRYAGTEGWAWGNFVREI